jgi:hypothetical protein
VAYGKVTIDVSSVRELQRYLTEMENRVDDFTVPLTDGTKLMYRDMLEAVATHGASWGELWDGMAQSTIVRHGPHALLDYSGAMLRSLTRFVRKTVAGVSGNATTILMEHGRSRGWRGAKTKGKSGRKAAQYAAAFGDSSGLEMPARDLMGYRDETLDAIAEMCLDYAVDENARIAA